MLTLIQLILDQWKIFSVSFSNKRNLCFIAIREGAKYIPRGGMYKLLDKCDSPIFAVPGACPHPQIKNSNTFEKKKKGIPPPK